jgi:hypothetical protein
MSIAITEAIATLAEAEGTVTLLLASPLLAIAGFYDPPFRVRAEVLVQLTLDDGEEVLQGRIDVTGVIGSVLGGGVGIEEDRLLAPVENSTRPHKFGSE